MSRVATATPRPSSDRTLQGFEEAQQGAGAEEGAGDRGECDAPILSPPACAQSDDAGHPGTVCKPEEKRA